LIRPATYVDIPAMVELGRAMATEAPEFQGRPFSSEKVWETIEGMIPTGGAFVAERDGEVVGAALGFCLPAWWSEDLEAGELAVFMRPDCRGGREVVRLVQALEAWAREQGATVLTLGVSTGVALERTGRLYERLGFHHMGSTFSRSLA
jgi:GNAT superfamily N-acetyltransferase